MASIKELRLRIKSVGSIKQITRAMEMVATTKLRRFQDRAVASRPYAEEIAGLVGRLAAMLGRPLTGVSANLHGKPPARTSLEVQALPVGVDLVLDGGTTPGGPPSTIVDLCGERPALLREGVLPATELRSILPDLTKRHG